MASSKRRADTRTMFAGSIADVSIGDLFQTLEMAGKASRVEFDTDVGNATVWFRERAIVGASCGGSRGADAVYRVAMADEGTFIATFREEELAEPVHLPPQFVLMEAARRRDEWLERAGEGLRAATRVALGDAEAAEALGDDARALLGRVGDGALVIDLIPPGEEAVLAGFRPLRALLEAGALRVVAPPATSPPTPVEESVVSIVIPVEPMDAPFWDVAFAAYVRIEGPPWRAAARSLALAVMLVGLALAAVWASGRALVGGLALGWGLILVGHAASVMPQLPLRRPALVLGEPLLIAADLLDRVGVRLGFVGRGRRLAERG